MPRYQVAFPGDSLTKGFDGGSYTGGARKYLNTQWAAAGYERTIVPLGEFRDANFGYSDHSGLESDTASQITARVVANFGVLSTNVRVPDLWICLAGTNDAIVNNGTSNPSIFLATDYPALLSAMHGISPVPIVVSTIPDSSDAGVKTRINTINAGIAATWDAAETAGMTLERLDLRTTIGDWSAGTFSDAYHMNTAGYALMGAAYDTAIRSRLGLA